jgi:hypothetical protein
MKPVLAAESISKSFGHLRVLTVVTNVHERRIAASPAAVGELLDSLGRRGDLLWPEEQWPAMRFDGPLRAGASGGHGPIRYVIEGYEPGHSIHFRFTRPRGFDGTHRFEVIPDGAGTTVLRHVLEMRTTRRARWTWPVVFRPLHDALVEDAFDKAERQLGSIPRPRRWGWTVRALRTLIQSVPRTVRARP